jgi:chaperone required for assembly of F1-ATPase
MRDILTDFSEMLSDPDPVRRAQIQMHKPMPKRFYKEVSVSAGEGGYLLLLDGKPVKTPTRNTLAVKTEAAALLLAAEWDAQVDVINPVLMPCTRLVNTAIDGLSDNLEAVQEDIVRFAGSDHLCYRADGPDDLVSLQHTRWDPVLDWVAGSIGARFVLVEGIIHSAQPQRTLDAFAAHIARFDDAVQLACLHTITTLSGSAILTLAFAQNHLSADEVWSLAHLDEDWQISKWGTDDEAELRNAKRHTEFAASAALYKALL